MYFYVVHIINSLLLNFYKAMKFIVGFIQYFNYLCRDNKLRGSSI